MISCSATAMSSSSNFGSGLSAFPALAGLLLFDLTATGAVTAIGALTTVALTTVALTTVAFATPGFGAGFATTAFAACFGFGFGNCFTTRAIFTLSFPIREWRGPVLWLRLPTAPPSPSPGPFRPRIARGLSHCAYPSCAPGGFCPQAQQPPRHQHSAAEPPTRV